MTTTLRDAHGEALSTTERTCADAYDHALELFNSFRMDPVAVLTPVLQQDPGFVSGHLLMAALMLSTSDMQLLGMAQACVQAAAASPQPANARERSLTAALSVWSAGDPLRANQLLGRHVIDHPRDLLALQLAHLGDLALGHSFMLRDRVARSLKRWSAADKGYGYLLGMHAFGLEECNEYARAEALGRRAFELQAHDAWAVHAVAHVCEMQGRTADGIAWLRSTRQHWATDCGMAVHNHWHLALMLLNSGDTESALAVYDSAVAPSAEALALNLDDASALLWRLTLRHADVADRWQVLAARWKLQAAWGGCAFNDVHAMMALAAAGDEGTAALGLDAIAEAARVRGTQDWAAVALPAGQAIQAFAAGSYARATDLLLPLLATSHPLGGSHAQRDVLHLTAMEAAARAGDHALSRALGDERAARTAQATA